MRGERIQIPLQAGHHRPASETSFKWRFAGVPMLAKHKKRAWQLCDFSGVQTDVANKNYIFVFFRDTPCPPS